MKRDMDLVRQVLVVMEKHDEPHHRHALHIEGYDDRTVSYHVKLLAGEGFIEAIDASAMSGICWIPGSLTWDGHEMLDAMRDDTVWRNFKAWLKKEGLRGASLGTILQLLQRQEVLDFLARLGI